jgi:hypothetical protein
VVLTGDRPHAAVRLRRLGRLCLEPRLRELVDLDGLHVALIAWLAYVWQEPGNTPRLARGEIGRYWWTFEDISGVGVAVSGEPVPYTVTFPFREHGMLEVMRSDNGTPFASTAGRPAAEGSVNAALDGTVFVTGPVAGVVVSAYAVNLDDGAAGALIAQSTPTDSAGAYHLDLGSAHGPLLLVARGYGTYVEPATAVMVRWDAGTELRGVFAARRPTGEPRIAMETGEQATVVLTPWSDWAVAYASARVKTKRDTNFADALPHALQRIRDHVELDFWSVAPAPMADGPVGAWNDGVQAGVLLAGLSALTAKMASDSQLSPAGLSSLALVAAVRDDLLADAVLDGMGVHGPLALGTCSTVCKLGPPSLRASLRDAATSFLASNANTSGIMPTDAAALLARVSSRTGDPWPARTAPTVTLVPGLFEDDDGVVARVDGPGFGAVEYLGHGRLIVLDTAGAPASFIKFASRYSAEADNLPVVRFQLTGDAGAAVRVRLSRRSTDGAMVVLKDWVVVPAVAGDAFNRAVAIRSALHPDVARVSGAFTLEFRATDDLGNATPVDCAAGVGCVRWTQTILPPPLRQRAAGDGDICTDAAIPTGHALGGGGPCPGLDNTASVNLTADRKIANGSIDNPTSMPVQVMITATAPSSIRRGLRFENLQVADRTTLNRSCDDTGLAPVTPDGACYDSTPATSELGTDEVLDRDLVSAITVTGATPVGTDPAGRPIYEIAPRATATVWLVSSPWSFLMDRTPADYGLTGPIQLVTGYAGNDWLRCVQTGFSSDGDHYRICTHQVLMREFTQLTRATVQPRSSVTLTARPSGSDEATWMPATGTDVVGFRYTDFAWVTEASGY